MHAHAITLLAGALSLSAALPASAQQTIKIGELNSYKSQPAFLEPYKKGWEMATDEINAAGGVLGKKLEIVSRDDGAQSRRRGARRRRISRPRTASTFSAARSFPMSDLPSPNSPARRRCSFSPPSR